MKVDKDGLQEWQKDHWRAVALCDLIMTATTETEENERLEELRKLKKKWGFTLITGYDPNAIRTRKLKLQGLSKDSRRVPEEYIPASGSVGESSQEKNSRRVHGTSHGR